MRRQLQAPARLSDCLALVLLQGARGSANDSHLAEKDRALHEGHWNGQWH